MRLKLITYRLYIIRQTCCWLCQACTVEYPFAIIYIHVASFNSSFIIASPIITERFLSGTNHTWIIHPSPGSSRAPQPTLSLPHNPCAQLHNTALSATTRHHTHGFCRGIQVLKRSFNLHWKFNYPSELIINACGEGLKGYIHGSVMTHSLFIFSSCTHVHTAAGTSSVSPRPGRCCQRMLHSPHRPSLSWSTPRQGSWSTEKHYMIIS